MIVIIVKQLVNGRWANIDGSELYYLGQKVTYANGLDYVVKEIIGSKITLELVEDVNG